MPELPEVETVVRELKGLEGRKISKVLAHWDKTIDGDTDQFNQRVRLQIISKVYRRGKYISIMLSSGDHITVHLRMTGKLIFQPNARDKNYVRAEFVFSNRSKLYFVDVRKFGRIKLWPKEEAFLPKLGPEPLEQSDVIQAFLNCRSQKSIKKILLDQSVLTGVGNIYADEALFLAGIHPEVCFQKVSRLKLKKLSEIIPEVMHRAIANMGTTLSDYRNTKNMGGENQNYLNVYGQTGEPCFKCGSPIVKIVVGQRGTHYCPKCQKR
jgi:formamidopyrimidine-DNA glycosylase